MSRAVQPNRRRYLRYPPSSLISGEVDLDGDDANAPFLPTLGALVVDESHTGCGLIVRKCDCEPKIGDVIVVRLGKLGPLRAEVAWLIELDADVLRVGVNFVPQVKGDATNG